MKDGNVLHPTNLERHSILLREQMDEGEALEMQQEQQDAQQGNLARMQQQEQQEQQEQQQQQMQQEQQGQGPPPPEGQGGSMAGAPDEGMVEQGEL